MTRTLLTTVYRFGDIVLVPYPFTDQSGVKKRPAVVVSSDEHNNAARDVVLMPVTSQVRKPLAAGEVEISEWKRAGLLKLSIIKPLLMSVDRRRMQKKLGRLARQDIDSLRIALHHILG